MKRFSGSWNSPALGSVLNEEADMDTIKGILAILVFIIVAVIALPFICISAVCLAIGYPASWVGKGLGKIRDKVMNYLLA